MEILAYGLLGEGGKVHIRTKIDANGTFINLVCHDDFTVILNRKEEEGKGDDPRLGG